MKEHLLWDLDGTLTDPRQGITRCYQFALEKSNLPVPEQSELLWTIGPPIQQTFAQLVPGADEAEIWRLVAKYRERFAEIGMYENEVYAGIPQLLEALGHKKKFIATSKPRVFAEKILAHFGLAQYFNGIYGSELDGRRSDKGELIKYILASENIDARDAAIVGDRKHDIVGAKKSGITAIAITWGYGSRDELTSAGADHIFDSPAQLLEALRQ